MKVSLAKHGGNAAAILMNRPAQVLDTDTLAPEAAAELRRLIGAAKAASPETAEPARVPDAMTYAITIEDGGETTVLRQSDAAMSEPFAALLDRLGRALKAQQTERR